MRMVRYREHAVDVLVCGLGALVDARDALVSGSERALEHGSLAPRA
jgi:hypothetical protein